MAEGERCTASGRGIEVNNRHGVRPKTGREEIAEMLAEKGVNHSGVKWVNLDVWDPDNRNRGWMVRLDGRWVRMGKNLKEALSYAGRL